MFSLIELLYNLNEIKLRHVSKAATAVVCEAETCLAGLHHLVPTSEWVYYYLGTPCHRYRITFHNWYNNSNLKFRSDEILVYKFKVSTRWWFVLEDHSRLLFGLIVTNPRFECGGAIQFFVFQRAGMCTTPLLWKGQKLELLLKGLIKKLRGGRKRGQ